MKEYKLELLKDPYTSCRTKPAARIAAIALLEMKTGDTLVIEGLERFYPLERIKEIVESSGLIVRTLERKGERYIIKAYKP